MSTLDGGTAGLMSVAASWSLSGDKHLLDLLQNIHERIIEKCKETKSKFEEMDAALDSASVTLQNVNNKFMALSNSQFVESRVYDDDVEASAEPVQTQPTEIPSETEQPASKIARGLRALFNAHESVRIMDDSDSDTDSDDNRTVLRARDMYAHRPLPYIIGSQAWRSKWHVGLVAEESDSDSSTSMKQEIRQTEQYSDSGPEMADEPTDIYTHERVESTYSLDTPSEDESIPQSAAKPSDVAAELARRLGGNVPDIQPSESEMETSQPVPRKIYKPEKPAPANIFFDEPPPLDPHSDMESSAEENDIFADLHNNAPFNQPNKVQNATEDLFRDLKNAQAAKNSKENLLKNANSDNDYNSDFGRNDSEITKKYAADESTDIVDYPPTIKENKKPVGGVSLFGAGAGADRIGAAILKRNRRQSNSSDDNLGDDDPKDNHTPPRDTNTESVEAINVQTEIFDRLFEKSEKLNKTKPNKKEKVEKPEPKLEVKKLTKIDLFSDDLFDDIDDIFSSVPTVSNKDRDKRHNLPGSSQSDKESLFDDGEDIFVGIAEVKTDKTRISKDKNEEKKRGLFDSDYDLFDDKSDIKSTVKRSTVLDKKPDESKASKDLFDESDDELFANVKDTKVSTVKNTESTPSEVKTAIVTNITFKDKDFVMKEDDIDTFESDNLFPNVAEKSEVIKKTNSEVESCENKLTTNIQQKSFQSPALFDDDDEDLFKTTVKNTEPSSLRTTKIISDHESLITTNQSLIENEKYKHKNNVNTTKYEDNKSNFDTPDKRLTTEDFNIHKNVKPKSPKNVFGNKDDEILFTDSESNIVNIMTDVEVGANDFYKNFSTEHKLNVPKSSQILLENDDDELFRNDNKDSKSLDVKSNIIDSNPLGRIFEDEIDDLFNVRNTDSKTASNFVDPKPLDATFKDNDHLFSNTVLNIGNTQIELEKDSDKIFKIESKSSDFINDDNEDLLEKIPGNSTNTSNVLDEILSTEKNTGKTFKSVNPSLLDEIFKANEDPNTDLFKKTLDSKDEEEKNDIKESNDSDTRISKIESHESNNFETSSKLMEHEALNEIFHDDENDDMFKMSSDKNKALSAEREISIKDYFNAESKSLHKIFKDEGDDLFTKNAKGVKNDKTIDSKTQSYHNEENPSKLFKTNETKPLDNIFDDENEDLFKTTLENNSTKIKAQISTPESGILEESDIKVPKFDLKSAKKLQIFDDTDDNYLGITIDTADTVQQDADIHTKVTQTINAEQKCDLNANKKETSPNRTVLDTEIFYDDIFADQPPEFEKPKEPKKSKNVNALFDDDSDDEALFFKRNETVFDEKPKKNSSELNPSEVHPILGLFGDEPPAIDFENPDNDNRLETPDPLREQSKVDFTEVKQDNVTIDTQRFNEEKSSKTLQLEEKETTDDTRNKKVIGHISTNIDINVKALLPGASPKKLLDKRTETKTDVLNEDNKEVKTVSFEDTNSTILDNTLSKERAKIPIRRRPSTRRARRDAATKSGIGFEDDLEKEINRNIPEDSPKHVIPKPGKSVTSKTVYILNDEDIFSDVKLPTKNDLESSTVTKTGIAVEESPLYKTTESGIQTLGKVYKNPKVEDDTTQIGTSKLEKPVSDQTKTSLFESSDDDGELFGAKKKTVREKSKSIFDSDSGDELFGGKK